MQSLDALIVGLVLYVLYRLAKVLRPVHAYIFVDQSNVEIGLNEKLRVRDLLDASPRVRLRPDALLHVLLTDTWKHRQLAWMGCRRICRFVVAASSEIPPPHPPQLEAVVLSRVIDPSTGRMKEQGVDERLQLAIRDTIHTFQVHRSALQRVAGWLGVGPTSLLLLVTGDGNEEAQVSSFPAVATAALEAGMQVEVAAWEHSMSRRWWHLAAQQQEVGSGQQSATSWPGTTLRIRLLDGQEEALLRAWQQEPSQVQHHHQQQQQQQQLAQQQQHMYQPLQWQSPQQRHQRGRSMSRGTANTSSTTGTAVPRSTHTGIQRPSIVVPLAPVASSQQQQQQQQPLQPPTPSSGGGASAYGGTARPAAATLFVAGVPPHVTRDVVRSYFSSYGAVREVKLLVSKGARSRSASRGPVAPSPCRGSGSKGTPGTPGDAADGPMQIAFVTFVDPTIVATLTAPRDAPLKLGGVAVRVDVARDKADGCHYHSSSASGARASEGSRNSSTSGSAGDSVVEGGGRWWRDGPSSATPHGPHSASSMRRRGRSRSHSHSRHR